MYDRERLARMPEGELAAILARPKGILRSDGFAWLVVGASVAGSTWGLAAILGGGWGWLIAAFYGVVLGWVPGGLVLHRLQRRFGREPVQEELLRRAGWKDIPAWRSELEASLRTGDGADWLVLLSGGSLPHGGTYVVRLDLAAGEPATGKLAFSELWYSEGDDTVDMRERFTSGVCSLTDGQAAWFRMMLADIASRPIVPGQKEGVKDGFPFDLRLVRRTPRLDVFVEGNLAAGMKDPRVEKIADELLRIPPFAFA